MNVIPAWIVQILQAGVAMDRISTYLDEEDVDEQVSTLKKGRMPPSDDDDKGLGILNGSFKWNEVEEKKDDKAKAKAKDANERKFWSWSRRSRSQSQGPSDDAATAVDSQSTAGSVSNGNGDHRFELRDITVMFPEGQLTVVTGPTASGKTALLVSLPVLTLVPTR